MAWASRIGMPSEQEALNEAAQGPLVSSNAFAALNDLITIPSREPYRDLLPPAPSFSSTSGPHVLDTGSLTTAAYQDLLPTAPSFPRSSGLNALDTSSPSADLRTSELVDMRSKICSLEDISEGVQKRLKIVEMSLEEFKSRLKTEVLEEIRREGSVPLRAMSPRLVSPPSASSAIIDTSSPKKVDTSSGISTKTSELEFAEAIVKRGGSISDQSEAMKILASYELQESIWDLGMLCGLPRMGLCGSLIVAVLLFTCVCIQVSFCLVCEMSFTSSPFDDDTLQGLQDFRWRNAQSVQYIDQFSNKNLAQIMCDGSSDEDYIENSMVYANTQIHTLSSIRAYLGKEEEHMGLGKLFDGRLMCLLALSCWILVVLEDARQLYHFCASIATIPRAYDTVLSPSHKDPSKLEIKCLAWTRSAIFYGITLVRLFCCCALLYVGCNWLSFTTSSEDLVLNAAALQFIFTIDELFFSAGAPLVSKVLLRQIAPITERGWVAYKGLDQVTLGFLILFIALVIVFYHVNVTGKLVKGMGDVEQILCGGIIGYWFGIDPELRMMWYKNVVGNSQLFHIQEDEALKSIDALIHGGAPNIGNNLAEPQFASVDLKTVEFTNFEVIVDSVNPMCQDVLHAGGNLQWTRTKLSNTSINDCSDMKYLCADLSSDFYWVRFLCPRVCECDHPDSIVPSQFPKYGCPSGCFHSRNYELYLEKLGSEFNCTDFPTSYLSTAPFWNNWRKQVLQFVEVNWGYSLSHPLSQETAEEATAPMLTLGCNWLHLRDNQTRHFLCAGSHPTLSIRPFSPICPEACKCTSGIVPQCSQQCVTW